MSDSSELIAQQILNASINKRNWKDVLYNVKAFGAIGDGVTDDTAAIQDTINMIPTNGRGVIFFPSGTYKVTSSIVITGKGVTMFGYDKITSALYFYGCNGIVHNGEFNFTISGLGLYTTGTTYTAIKLNNRNTLNTLELNEVDMFGLDFGSSYWGVGLHLEDVSNTWVNRLSYKGNSAVSPFYGGTGIKVSSTIAKPSTGHHFLNCSMSSVDTAFDIQASNFPSIEGIRIDKAGIGGRRGIYFSGVTSGYVPPLLTVTSSHVDLISGGTAIEINKVSQVEISGCDLYAFADNCTLIKADTVDSVKVHDNFFICGSNSNLTGVAIGTASVRVEIYNNQFSGNWTTGVSISANSTQCYERDNVFFGSGNHIVDNSNTLMSRVGNRVFATFAVNQSIANAINVLLSWSAASPNWGGMWNVANPTRITIPAGVKKISVSGVVRFNIEATTGRRQVIIIKNGGFVQGLPLITVNAVAASETDIAFSSGVFNVTTGDYLELQVLQTSGAGITASSGVTFFQVDILDYYNS